LSAPDHRVIDEFVERELARRKLDGPETKNAQRKISSREGDLS
jgi:hypothetical protein